jgi:hypothetical protein
MLAAASGTINSVALLYVYTGEREIRSDELPKIIKLFATKAAFASPVYETVLKNPGTDGSP